MIVYNDLETPSISIKLSSPSSSNNCSEELESAKYRDSVKFIYEVDSNLLCQQFREYSKQWKKYAPDVSFIFVEKLLYNDLKAQGLFDSNYKVLYVSSLNEDEEDLKATFHHELSSYFFHHENNKKVIWEKYYYNNVPSNSKSQQQYASTADCYMTNEKLLSSGFLNKYSTSDPENDFNLYAEIYFTNEKKLFLFRKQYPLIEEKFQLFKEMMPNVR